ncbi:acyltransferase family protein [Peribacillus sp. NPDC097895]|uniref:acyltransferase family protein n=1 Tax=Peribacillus sp. NPDC097895 TaxID=3390619 RepID=UPI003D005FAE
MVLILFVALGSFIGSGYPESMNEFLSNFFLITNSYNSAWWFMQTYVILVALSPLLVKLIKKYNSMYLIIIFGLVYLISYIQRIMEVIDFNDSVILSTISHALGLVGTSLFPFIIGSIFAKEKIYSKIYDKCYGMKYKNAVCILLIFSLVLGHSLYESMIIAPFTAIAFICIFTLMNKNIKVKRLLEYLGDHSTSVWLTHMFFYMTLFPELTFMPKYPILFLAWLFILCLVSSHIINSNYNPVISLIFTNKTKVKIKMKSVAG